MAALKPIQSLARALRILLTLTCAAALVAASASISAAATLSSYEPSTPLDNILLTGATRMESTTALAFVIVLLGCGVVFIAWLYRARHNAEVLSAARHRRSRGWAIGAWFVPIVQLWFPKQVVEDAWRASDPETPAGQASLDGVPHPGPVTSWWAAWLAAVIVDRVVYVVAIGASTVGDQQRSSILAALALVVFVGAGYLALKVVSAITGFQTARGTEGAGFPAGPGVTHMQ